jgi:uncharacterized membrane protein YgaE (UPF0421/DUF939 family)
MLLHNGLLYGLSAAFVAVFAYLTASQFRFLHEAFWAAIAAVVSLFPQRQATVRAGAQQFAGAAIGGVIGWATAAAWHHHLAIYGAAVFLAVVLCYVVRLPDAARLSAVAVTIILLIPMPGSPATVAFHRFFEVSYGVACAIVYTVAVDRIARLVRRRRPP